MNQVKGSASSGGMQSIGRKVICRHSHAANENQAHDQLPNLGNLPRPVEQQRYRRESHNNYGSSVVHPISLL